MGLSQRNQQDAKQHHARFDGPGQNGAMRLIVFLFAMSLSAFAQVSALGSMGAVQSSGWSNAALSYGAGGGYTHKRLTVSGEVWRAEVDRQRNAWLSRDRRVEAIAALAAWRVWRNVHAEGGAGIQRDSQHVFGAFLDSDYRKQSGFATAGAYYQTPGRVFVRVGYRRLFVRGDHDTNQIYSIVGVSF